MLNMMRVNPYQYFVNEREHIRREREAGAPRPWTTDETLHTYRFCNMRRRDDRVSRWAIEHIFKPYHDHPRLWLMAAIFRWINWPPTVQEAMDRGLWKFDDGDDMVRLGAVVDDRVRRGEKGQTGAYLINAKVPVVGQRKFDWLARDTWTPLMQAEPMFLEFFKDPNRTVEQGLALFDTMYNHGRFMAGQIVADWTYTPLLDSASDLKTYAPVGPGSSRGMHWLHDEKVDKYMTQEMFTERLTELMQVVGPMVRGSETFTAHDWQNTLCEFSKWIRKTEGGTAPRARYTPEQRY